MCIRTLIRRVLSVIAPAAFLLVLLADFATGQSKTPAGPAGERKEPVVKSGADVDRQVPSLVDRYEKFAKLVEGPAKELQTEITTINAKLGEGIRTIREAEKVFDQMYDALKKAVSIGKHDSDFVKNIDELARSAQDDAIAARNRGSIDNQKEFEKQAADFTALREVATKLYDRSFKSLQDIEDAKAEFIDGLKLSKYQEAQRHARRGIKLLEDMQKGLSGLPTKKRDGVVIQ